MRAPRAFHGFAVDNLRSRPTFGRTHDEHGPSRPAGRFIFLRGVFARSFLDGRDAVEHAIENSCGLLVHHRRIVAFERERLIAVAAHQVFQLRMRNARQHRGIGDLVAVQMQDRQHRAVGCWIQKLVGVPACGQRPGLRFAIAHHAGHNQIGIVERRAVGVHQGVTQLAALVDGARRFRRHVAGNAVRPTELPEQPLDAVTILPDVGINFRIRAFEIRVRDNSRTAVPRADHEDHIQPALADEPVPVHVKKIEAGRGAPVSQQPRLHVVERQRPLQQRIVLEIDLANGKIIRRPPVGIHCGEQFRAQRALIRSLVVSSIEHDVPRKRGVCVLHSA